jgi:parvulin-like peptidyl-prolyl isomerase
VEVSDAEVAAYYQEHPDAFHVPETVTLRQILVATSNEARDVRRRLARDPRSFEAIAREVSKGPEGKDGGIMGSFAPGQLPTELDTAAFSLKEGVVSEIVETSLGFHVLRVDKKEPAREETLPEATAHIRTLLERQKADRRLREFVSGLMARAKVNHAAALPASRPS